MVINTHFFHKPQYMMYVGRMIELQLMYYICFIPIPMYK